MRFKTLKISDQELYETFKASCPLCQDYLGSELNFQNLMTWKVTDQIEYAIIDEKTMVIKGKNRGIPYFFAPMAKTSSDFIEAIQIMEKCAVEHNVPFLIKGLSEEMVDLILKSGLKYRMDEERDYAEYLYSSDSLRTLTGKKYNKKRNLLNQFMKNDNYIYKSYEKRDEPLIKDLLYRWESKKSHAFEHKAIFDALENLKVLNLFCDLIVIDGVAHAFSIGTKSNKMGLVLFEKADTTYTGIYQAMNYLFANKHFYDVELVNRQEDLGILELRKAKMSYHPIGFVKKYSLMRNHLTMAEVKELKDLYQEAFNDSEGYLNYFFSQKYRAENVIFIKESKKIVSALHLVKKSLKIDDITYPLPFVVAAATLKSHQNQGYMKRVLKQSLTELYNRKYPLCALAPFDESFYQPFGFETIIRTNQKTIPLDTLNSFQKRNATREDIDTLINIYSSYTKDKTIYIDRKISDWEALFNEVSSDEGLIVILSKNNEDIGYYTLFKEGIEEFCLLDDSTLPNEIEFNQGLIEQINQTEGVSRLMIRIVDTKRFLERYPFNEDITDKFRIRIQDDLFEGNDVTIELSINQGNVSIRDIEVYDTLISVTELTRWAFILGKYPFKLPNAVIFDRY